jgi:ABC-type Zn uptake system ZnuABC Zn-binding protein ZnuA
MKKDKKKYDAVQAVREIRDQFSEYHHDHPEEFKKELKAAREKLALATKTKKPD